MPREERRKDKLDELGKVASCFCFLHLFGLNKSLSTFDGSAASAAVLPLPACLPSSALPCRAALSSGRCLNYSQTSGRCLNLNFAPGWVHTMHKFIIGSSI